jgi:hypothetical protein
MMLMARWHQLITLTDWVGPRSLCRHCLKAPNPYTVGSDHYHHLLTRPQLAHQNETTASNDLDTVAKMRTPLRLVVQDDALSRLTLLEKGWGLLECSVISSFLRCGQIPVLLVYLM